MVRQAVKGPLSSRRKRVAGDVAAQAAFDLAACLALARSASDVVPGQGVVSDAGLDDDVQCPVELAVAVTVEPVAVRLPVRGHPAARTEPHSRPGRWCPS